MLSFWLDPKGSKNQVTEEGSPRYPWEQDQRPFGRVPLPFFYRIISARSFDADGNANTNSRVNANSNSRVNSNQNTGIYAFEFLATSAQCVSGP